jgi:hypothetical protein
VQNNLFEGKQKRLALIRELQLEEAPAAEEVSLRGRNSTTRVRTAEASAPEGATTTLKGACVSTPMFVHTPRLPS